MKLNQHIVDWKLSAESFWDFNIRVAGGVTVETFSYYGGGQIGIGGELGELSNGYSSPGNPLFFLHHANMDRLWDQWQRQDWPTRRSDISGPENQLAHPFNFFGDLPCKNITLEYEMDLLNLMPDQRYIKIRDIMDTKCGELCYTYE